MKPADAKLQRWIDLIAALLRHHYGATFAELKELIPAYGASDKDPATVARMFERDKDELRALGIPIRVRLDDPESGDAQRYSIKPRELYLPYLALTSGSAESGNANGASLPIPPAGYRTLPRLVFEPDELSVLLAAARRAAGLGEPTLARDAAAAIRKLTHDVGLALGAAAAESGEHAARVPERDAVPTVTVLGGALLRRKRVGFVYRSMRRDATDERTVEPYGLFFASGHWYLTGRDVAAAALRKFRVSRIERVAVNTKRPQGVDYVIPPDFRLAEHARLREPWEAGEDAAEEMIVEIRGTTGAAMSVRSLGADIAGDPRLRRFQVRRADSFVRWLMSFAGEVVPVSPPSLREQYRAMVAATLRAYEPARPT